METAGLSERVSEVTLIDVRDVRVQLAGKDSQIEVRLGSQELGSRLKIAPRCARCLQADAARLVDHLC